eukprot:TRINITY_DN969_c0_g1_i3.p1 TRINITY_DN969_c0_g1~~TRINITY_DN969_c0_g1_i3.p1  ORF type:complete len:1008 (-),score=339.25 TRINITY_DN969_c0_g1_i3:69-3029(-)
MAPKKEETKKRKAEDKPEDEPATKKEAANDVEKDDRPDARPASKATVAWNGADTTLNVVAAMDGKVLMAITEGGMQYLIAGARASLGMKSGRYMYEVRIIEALNPSESTQGAGARTPQPRQLVRLGFSTADSSLILGDDADCAYFDSEGNFGSGQMKRKSTQSFSRDQVIGVLLNLDPSSPNTNTISLFRDGARIAEPQKIPESLHGKTLFPHICFRNVTIQVNMGPTLLKELPFTSRMIQKAAAADVVESKSGKGKDGKCEVMLPVAMPDEGTFDWLDDFLKANPSYVELSDRKLHEWATSSGLLKSKGVGSSNDKPTFNYNLPSMDDGSLQRLVNSVAATVPRNYVVMEVKSNLVAQERAEVLKRFSRAKFKRTAMVVMGEPSADFKQKSQERLLKEKQAKEDNAWKVKKAQKEQQKAQAKRQKALAEARKKAEEQRKKLVEEAMKKKAEAEAKKKAEEEAKKKAEEAKEAGEAEKKDDADKMDVEKEEVKEEKEEEKAEVKEEEKEEVKEEAKEEEEEEEEEQAVNEDASSSKKKKKKKKAKSAATAEADKDKDKDGDEEDKDNKDVKEGEGLTSQEQLLSLLRSSRVCEESRRNMERPHPFWDTQPVPAIGSEYSSSDNGPIDEPKTPDDVKAEPYNLPGSFEWCTCDLDNDEEAKEIYTLLCENYVEDDDCMFRFDYSVEFLRWALKPPEYLRSWHLGVRVKGGGKLVGFITGIPANIQVYDQTVKMAEINFLCVHKKLRSKRLAPVLIKEITRRVNRENIWQAVYTAGVVLPRPVSECRYWHRSLNPKKLIDVGFSHLGPRMTMARTIKLYKVPDEPQLPGMRKMEEKDVQRVFELISGYLKKFPLHPEFTKDEVEHWVKPREKVVYAFVREDEAGEVKDVCSFYSLPSTILKNEKYDTLHAAYSYWNVATTVPLNDLMYDALIYAKQQEFDVFNALNVMENETFLKELKFGIGDGSLQYYLYNWKCAKIEPGGIGLVLL